MNNIEYTIYNIIMIIFVLIIAGILLLILFSKRGYFDIFYNITHFFDKTDYIKYKGKIFEVLENLDKEESAILLYNLNRKAEILIGYLESRYNGDYQKYVDRLEKHYNSSNLKELPILSKPIAYNKRKGWSIGICLRTKKQKAENENTQFFVFLHELAHLCVPEKNHSKEFWKAFKFLLKTSVKLNLYVYENYNKKPVTYCGYKINSTPWHY